MAIEAAWVSEEPEEMPLALATARDSPSEEPEEEADDSPIPWASLVETPWELVRLVAWESEEFWPAVVPVEEVEEPVSETEVELLAF